MPLQSQVNTYAAPGVPGMKADMNTFDYHPNSLTAEAPIGVGTFVWRGSDPAAQGKYGGSGAPLGLVERNTVYPLYDIAEDGSAIVAEGETLTVATRGAFWALTTTAAIVGQSVFAKTADGSIAAADAGASVAGAVETGWIVESAGDIGDVIIIKRS
jgi:hypothetical protein